MSSQIDHDFGEHFIVGFSGLTLTEEERAKWGELKPQGTIIFARNIAKAPNWPETLRSTLEALRELSGREDFIVSIDHEGGRVHRLTPPVTHFPAPATWGARAYEVGIAIGEELSALGVTLDYAPCFDILTEPANKVIGDRALGTTATEVTERALSFLRGLESRGVMGCAKHFPGHGGTIEDSHETLPKVDTSLELLNSRELIPFASYIQSGRKLIMTAHVVVKSLDDSLPATISPKILKELLRDKLKYEGALITDALDMGALKSFAPQAVATKFIRASGDLFCVCQGDQSQNIAPIDSAIEFASGLKAEAKSDSQFLNDLRRSSDRISNLLKEHRLITSNKLPKSQFGDYAQLNSELRDGVV